MPLLARRVIQLVVVLLIVSFFAFTLVRILPGDPTKTILPFGTPAQRAQLKKDLGLDKSFFEQYGDYLGNVVQGDLGHRYSTNTRVSDLVKQSLPVSLQLMIYAQLLALLFAIPLGVLTAYRAGTRTDRSVTTSSFALIALPNFVLGLLLSYIVGVKLKWLPVGDYHGGWLDPLFGAGRDTNIGEHIRDMVLPAITLAAGQIAIYMRLLRSDMVATLQENFILMAKSKGISNRRILWRHALRPSSLTLLTVAGLNVGTLIGGSIVVEVIFQIPGMGKQIFDALASREYVELQGFILVLATVFVLVNFLVDVLYLVLDPRIRRARAAA
ncbi:MAG: ABC transporter permease [Actinobacteria bacterium]|nr:MAG: ABC transporter permease [Actinomycetota bacterium]